MANLNTTVYFRGDANQLFATYKAVGAQGESLVRQMASSNAAYLKSLQGGMFKQGTGNVFGDKAAGLKGPLINSTTNEFDALNNTIKTTYSSVIRLSDGNAILAGSFTRVHGNLEKLLEAQTKYDAIASQRPAIVDAARQAVTAINSQTSAAVNAARAMKASEKADKEAAKSLYASGGRARDASGQFITLKQRLAEITKQYQLLDSTGRRASLSRFTKEIEAQGIAAKKALPEVAALTSLRADLIGARGARLAAENAAPPIPASIAQLKKLSPQLLKQLQQSGLPLGAEALHRQEAEASFSKNLVTGVTQIRGSFKDLDGIEQSFNAEIDKSGKLITRFGGQLSGLQNFLNQTVRNFQKVVQWGIATTAVFGSIAFAARELSVLSELNKNLTRLSITANLSKDETNSLFNSLANIGIATATPLTEITASADDIALAVRQAGQSTESYMKDITNLTEAVGIYTNLTGTDTVRATDLLTSAMKQLGLQTEDVTGLLSKITAVAGGQSTAISDITSGLAAMAEAAHNAGLSVDQTIATVQILSQVTAKTPAEIATSFKNLVGALENPAAIKQLKALNIALVSEGNNIIKIYSEISEKIRTGAIGATEVSGILRNLAGGPRRAPDAAALLSNIDKIASGEARAFRATNEALIANAKILSTVQAKAVQVQAQFDKLVYQKFGPAFEKGVETLVDALKGLINILNQIPTGFIAGGIQLAIFLTAMRLGVGIARAFVGIMNGLRLSIAGLVPALGAASIATKQLTENEQLEMFTAKETGEAEAQRARLSISQRGLGVAAAAGIGALGGLAVGGDIKSVLGGGLSGLGLGLLTVPSPEPWTKLAGGVALAAGTLVTFLDDSQKVAKQNEINAEKAQELLNIYSKYNESNVNIGDLKTQQEKLRETIDTLNKEQNKTPEVLAQLDDAQKQYVNNTLQMADANTVLQDSIEKINTLYPELGGAIRRAQTGLIRPEELEKEIQKLQLKILQQTNPAATLPEGKAGLLEPINAPITPYTYQGRAPGKGTLTQTESFVKGQGTVFQPFDLKDLETKSEDVKKLFSALGTEITSDFSASGENISLVSSAIQHLKESGDSLAPTLEKTFNEWVRQNSAIDGARVAIESYQARIDALKVYKPEQAAELQKLLDLGKKVIEQAQATGDSTTIYKTSKAIYDLLSGGKDVTKENILPLLDTYAKQIGLFNDKALEGKSKMEIYAIAAEQLGINLKDLGIIFGDTGGKVAQFSEELLASLDAVKEISDKTLADYATKSAELTAQIQQGKFKGDPEGLKNAKAQIEQLKQMAASAGQLNKVIQDVAGNMGDKFTSALTIAEEKLQGVTGLQDASRLSIDKLVERLFYLADAYDLSSDEVKKLTGYIIGLIESLNAIPKYNKVIVDYQFKINTINTLSNASPDSNASIRAEKNLAREIKKANEKASPDVSSAKDIAKKISDLLSKAFGATGKSAARAASGGGGGKSGPDVSTVDLPDEIANAANRSALIREAVKRARALQAKIPGATAEGKNDIVELLKGTQRILEVRGVKDDLLRRALEELAAIEKKRLEFETKADTIRRIRIGSGTFGAIANVPVNSRTGVSVGGQEGPINITLNLNGTVLTPAQLSQFADMVGASIKRQIAG